MSTNLPPAAIPATHAIPATTVRYRVIAVCSLMSGLLYLDRFCVSFAETYIKQDLRLSEFQISAMFSAFFVFYALAQPASGWMADRFGGRKMLTLYIAAWSLFTGLVGLANGFAMLILLRLGLGLAQAGAYPTAANLVAKWAPLTRRGLASSLVALGGRIGGVMSLFVTGYVILYFTPVSVSSQITPPDILQVQRLCYELVYGNRPVDRTDGDGGTAGRVGQQLLISWPTDLRNRVRTVADDYRAAAAAAVAAATSPPTGAAAPPVRPTDDEPALWELRRSLADALNAPLRQPDPFQAGNLLDVQLEREALQLFRAGPENLSEAQCERMNRLVLEAVFPACIKRVYCAGWRSMMQLYGFMGLPVVVLFWMICRDEPRKHPRCNAAELVEIEQGRAPAAAADQVGGLPLKALLANQSMWFNGAMQFFTNVGWVFLVTYAPRYFIEVHSAPVAQRTWMTSIPVVAACVGMFLGGVITDPAVRWWGNRWGRSLPIALTRFAAAATYLLCLLNPSPWTAVAILAVTSLICDLGIPAVWAFQQDVGGKYSGSVLGWGNMWGNFGAVVGPQLIGAIVGQRQNWNVVFVACAAAFLLSGIAALGVDARQTITPSPRE